MPSPTSQGQRQINMIWEITQGIIALTVVGATVFVAAKLAFQGDTGAAAFVFLSNSFSLVIGFYFGRTNHTRWGDPGV